jgi:ABC-type multidrug transport system fused ATPase/permease subunit
MSVVDNVREANRLLTRHDRRKLGLAVVLQAMLAMLDLLGVVLLGLVAALASSAVSEELPESASSLADRFGVVLDSPARLAAWLALAAAVLLLTKSALSFVVIRRVMRFLAGRQVAISSRLATSLLSRPLVFVQDRSSQESAYALTTGVNAATIGILGQGVIVLSETALIVVLLIGLLLIDPVLTLFTVVFFAGIALLLSRVMSAWAHRLGSDASAAEIEGFVSVQEAVHTYRETAVTGRHPVYLARFRGLRTKAAYTQADIAVMTQVSKYVFEAALIIGGGLLVASQAVSSDLTTALTTIVVYLAAATRIMPSMLRIQAGLLTMRTSSGLAAPTLALADALRDQEVSAPSITDSDDGSSRLAAGVLTGFDGFDPSVTLRDVSFTYPGQERPAIDAVTLSIDPGSSLAVVGTTGAGKSTLADLILGVLSPDAGNVHVGGVSPAEAIRNWPGALAYVPQEVGLVDGTVRDNVALCLPVALVDDDRVWEALERAHVADVIRDLPGQLDAPIGEDGVRLSGGQRQRLGIARALYTRPRLIVLDEATSALDAETERAVGRTMADLEGDVTLVVIAHRLATIRTLDTVAYLSDGRLVARGSFDEVRVLVPAFDEQATLLGI